MTGPDGIDTGGSGPGGIDDARLPLRTAGYCVLCDRIVERASDGSCPQGHAAEALCGRTVLSAEEPIPQLPRFNHAAFWLPPVWGPAHGEWVGVVFLPIWLFADSVIASAVGRPWGFSAGALFVLIATIAFEAFFAKRANGQAWRRVCDRMSVAEYVRRERLWALACVPVGVVLFVGGVWWRVVHGAG